MKLLLQYLCFGLALLALTSCGTTDTEAPTNRLYQIAEDIVAKDMAATEDDR